MCCMCFPFLLGKRGQNNPPLSLSICTDCLHVTAGFDVVCLLLIESILLGITAILFTLMQKRHQVRFLKASWLCYVLTNKGHSARTALPGQPGLRCLSDLRWASPWKHQAHGDSRSKIHQPSSVLQSQLHPTAGAGPGLPASLSSAE